MASLQDILIKAKFMSLTKYKSLSDKQLIDLIVTKPYNEEAAFYLLYDRYSPKLKKICIQILGNLYWYDDCMGDLYDYLHGEKHDWLKIKKFEGRCHFGTWIGKVAYNRFLFNKPKLIGNLKNTIYIDDDTKGNKLVQLPDKSEDNEDKNLRRILLLEAIGKLKNQDQKFVILKTLQEYKSKQIAFMLKKKWDNDGIVKLNNNHELIIPNEGYIDVLRQHAKKELRKLLVNLK